MYTTTTKAILMPAIIVTTAVLLMSALGPSKAMAAIFQANPPSGNPHGISCGFNGCETQTSGNPHIGSGFGNTGCKGNPHGQFGFFTGTC